MQFSRMTDGLRNVIANLGTARDKSSHSVYVDPEIEDAQLAMMYRGSSIARKIVRMPAQDSFREWREWQANADQISAIEAEEERLGLIGKSVQAKTRARLFGGAVIYIGTTDTDAAKPLIPERMRLGGLKYLTVISRNRISAGPQQTDPRLEGYGQPKYYSIGGEEIHPSRVAAFKGEELPDDLYAGRNIGWGDSSLTSCLSDIRNLDATIANVATLVFEAKIDVLGIKNFNDDLRTFGDEYEALVKTKLALTATGKGINGMFIKDADDTYEQKNASFANLPQVIESFMQMTSAASGIPMMLLFGISPGGIGGQGSNEMRGYYDRIKVIQTLENQPEMHILDECLIRSALGSRPAEIHYQWRSLHQPTTQEKAATGKSIAETFKIASDIGDIPAEALTNSLVNALTENGIAPGLEAGYAKFFNQQASGDLQDDGAI
jgi:phage-related protein (TIGR01555 family)